MTTTRNYDEEIERFIGGDASVNDLKLDLREGEGGNYNLARKFFRFLGEQEALTHLDSLSIEIPYLVGRRLNWICMLSEAFRDTKLRSIKTLKLRCPCSGSGAHFAEHLLHGLVWSLRDGHPLQVENLDLKGVDVTGGPNLGQLGTFLFLTKSSLKHLSLDLPEDLSTQMAACIGPSLTQLNNLTSLVIGYSFDPDCEPDGLVLLYTILSEIVSLEKLEICSPYHSRIVDCICRVTLPKLTRLTHFGLMDLFACDDTRKAELAHSLGMAIQAHTSINSLHLDWWTIPTFEGIIPALQKCPHWKLCLESYDYDIAEHPPEHKTTISDFLRSNPTGFADLETFDLQFRSEDTWPELVVSIGASCPRLEKLTLNDITWCWRKEEERFPQPAEKQALVQIARMCPSLFYLKFYNTGFCKFEAAENYELAKQVRKIRLGVDDIVDDRIPADFPALLAKSWVKTENDQDVLVNLDVVFELFQEKAGIFFNCESHS